MKTKRMNIDNENKLQLQKVYKNQFYKDHFKKVILPLLTAFVMLILTSKLFITLLTKVPGFDFTWKDYIEFICFVFVSTTLSVWLVIVKCAKDMYGK